MIKYPLNVTIDSNIFDANKYDLSEDSTFSRLVRNVEAGKVKVYLSNIVLGEISQHIQDNARDVAKSVNKLHSDLKKRYSNNLLKNLDMEYDLTKVKCDEMTQKAQEYLNTFLEKLNVTYLDSHTIDAEKIFQDYFKLNPPFENNEKKRKEFPDAFIVAQIKERFPSGEKLAIVSNDKGFKAACGNAPNYMFFDSLGDLFNTLTKEDPNYNKYKAFIDNKKPNLCNDIMEAILNNDCVNVDGHSYDKNGKKESFDYYSTEVDKVTSVDIEYFTIDVIADTHVFATLKCTADIDMLCFYENYNTAVWDSVNNSYGYVEVNLNREIHSAKFDVRVKLNLKTKKFKLSEFTITLRENTRKEQVDATSNNKYVYEMLESD